VSPHAAPRRPVVRSLAAAGVLAVALGAGLARPTAGLAEGVGYDVSYPQCDGALPAGGAFAIVGVNGGRPFTANPCLAAQLAWAGTDAGLYANTANPGAALSTRWPFGQTAPQACIPLPAPAPDTPACAYDYGWNAAADAYQDAVQAQVALGWLPAGAQTTVEANAWWLDVESANSWSSDPALNVAALQGGVDFLRQAGAASVGLYASANDWRSITGGSTVFAALPGWLAGPGSLADALAACAGPAPPGGVVALVQFPLGGFDGDVSCAAPPVVIGLGAPPPALVAGTPSAPMPLSLSPPPSQPVPVVLSSTSPTGRFAAGPQAPWTPTLTLPVGAGGASFLYEDTTAGSATLSAVGAGLVAATEQVAVVAGAPAAIAVAAGADPLPAGDSERLVARGADALGNAVALTPAWSVAPRGRARLEPQPDGTVVLVALRPGRVTVTARQGAVAGSAVVRLAPPPPARFLRFGVHRAGGSRFVLIMADRPVRVEVEAARSIAGRWRVAARARARLGARHGGRVPLGRLPAGRYVARVVLRTATGRTTVRLSRFAV